VTLPLILLFKTFLLRYVRVVRPKFEGKRNKEEALCSSMSDQNKKHHEGKDIVEGPLFRAKYIFKVCCVSCGVTNIFPSPLFHSWRTQECNYYKVTKLLVFLHYGKEKKLLIFVIF